MSENWKPIEGFPAYEVSDLGRVRRAGKVLTPTENAKGYLYVSLRAAGKTTKKYVHRLVAAAFIPNPLGLPQVNHKGTNTDNRDSKLEWRSVIGHTLDRMQREQQNDGVHRHQGKWTAELKFGVRNYLGVFDTFEEAKAVHDKAVAALPYVQ